MSTRLMITGSKGRMGVAIIRLAGEDPEATVTRQVDLGDSLEDGIDDVDVIVDFSHHEFTTPVVDVATRHGKPIVIGTTGHSQEELDAIHRAAGALPIVKAPNFSIGVNTLFWLTRKTAEILGPEFDLEVVEMHHRMKTDAPSGTARRLGEILAEATGMSYERDTRHGRVGDVGARTNREIGMHALRGGDVVGDHTVIFANAGERVELTHKAASRDILARGAIRAAKWIPSRPPGLYDMQDILGLKD